MSPLWEEAQKHLAGGVNSPVRAFKSVGGTPVFMKQGLGPFLYDTHGRRYVDHCLSWGAILHGHADAMTVSAIQKAANQGTSFGACTQNETRLAQQIKRAFPRLEKLRFTSSGTEAVMSAVRLARGVTKKDRIVKFSGCYHGHADSLLVKAGSGLATFGSPDSLGIPKALAELTTVLPFNDAPAVKHFLKGRNDIACIIVEPVAGNMGLIPATKNFLETIARQTKKCGALLIFDEVISGFRVGFGGAQHLFGIQPDITTLGKIIGGGLPIGAFGARTDLMSALSPNGAIYQAGTLSGNPLSVAAGISVLSQLNPGFYKKLHEKSGAFFKSMGPLLKEKGACLQSLGSMFTVFFSKKPPKNFKEASQQNFQQFNRYFRKMLKLGIYLPPSGYEACFISMAHSQNELTKTLEALKKC